MSGKKIPPGPPFAKGGVAEAPYPGLRPYREDEQGKFFGREADKAILVDKILGNRLTLLFAASGVGKSSLLQAAVIPHLKADSGESLSVVYSIDWVRDEHSTPLSRLHEAILNALHVGGVLPADANPETDTLAELLEFCCLFARPPLVLILDQFEEFFRYQRHTAAFRPFIEQLTGVITDAALPVSMVISMREDYAMELNVFKPQLPTLLFENFYRLEKLGQAGTREAIVASVEQVGFRYEDALLKSLLKDLLSREFDGHPNSPMLELLETVEPPYLQIVCAQLWELNKSDPDKLLRLTTYENAGRAKGILSNYLSGVLQDFTLVEKQLASKAFDHLASQRGVKMACTTVVLAETIRVDEAALGKVLEKLAAVRILRSQQRGEAMWYELYHDMFSDSIESWNGAWKNRMRRRKFVQISVAGFISIAALFAGWDYYVNASHYYLRLSPKYGISDQVELWQGKLGSLDLFHQQRYIAETDFERNQLEPDKQFSQKPVADYNGLQTELIGNLPIEQRVAAYAKNGKFDEALKLAEKSIIPEQVDLAKRTLPELKIMDVPNAARLIYRLLTSNKFNMNDGYYDGVNFGWFSSSIGIFLIKDKGSIEYNMLGEVRDFWVNQLSNQLPTQVAREQLMALHVKPDMVRIDLSGLETFVELTDVRAYLIGLLNDEDEFVRQSEARILAKLQVKEAVPALIVLLKDKEAFVRSSAAEALAHLQAKEAIPSLIDLLKDKEVIVLSSAADALAELKSQEAIPALLGLLKDQNVGISSVGEALVHLQAQEAIPVFIDMLDNLDVDIKVLAASSLAELQAHEAIPALIGLLNGQVGKVRYSAIEALEKLQSREAIPALIGLLRDQDSRVRSSAIRALAQLQSQEAIPELIGLLKDQNEFVRSSAIEALAQLKCQESIPRIAGLLKDQNEFVRSSAVDALVQLQFRKAIPTLIGLLKDQKSSVKFSVAKALARLQPEAAILALIGLLKDEDLNVIDSSVKNELVSLPSKEVIPALIDALKDKDAIIRSSVTGLLVRLQSQDAIPGLIDLLKDQVPFVRSSAAEALGQLQAREATQNLINLLNDQDEGVQFSAKKALSWLHLKKFSEPIALREDFFLQPSLSYFLYQLKYLLPEIYHYEQNYYYLDDNIYGYRYDEVTAAILTALRMERSDKFDNVQKSLLRKALSPIAPQVIEQANQALEKADKEQELPVNQPLVEEKPLALDELKTKLDTFDKAYTKWRRHRDADPVVGSETDVVDNFSPVIYEYAYAIAGVDEDEGIKLLGHNLHDVRNAAAKSLANGVFLGVPLLQKLDKIWLETDNPITRASVFHAIDLILKSLEKSKDHDLEALKAYESTMTDPRSIASVKPRVEWTRIQLQWRLGAIKEMKALNDRETPRLLRKYCLNPDGTDMKPEECTIDR